MERGFLPYSDGFGNFWGSERSEYKNAAASQINKPPKPPQMPINQGGGGNVVYIDNSIAAYPLSLQAFFNASGTLKSADQIFFIYNGFSQSVLKNKGRCQQNTVSINNIDNDISSITQDPKSLMPRLLSVRNMMDIFSIECEAALAIQVSEELTTLGLPEIYPIPEQYNQITRPPVGGGSPLLEGDLSLYCSQVPDDPACTGEVSTAGIGSGKETNWLLIGGIAVAAYFGYKYFVKK